MEIFYNLKQFSGKLYLSPHRRPTANWFSLSTGYKWRPMATSTLDSLSINCKPDRLDPTLSDLPGQADLLTPCLLSLGRWVLAHSGHPMGRKRESGTSTQ